MVYTSWSSWIGTVLRSLLHGVRLASLACSVLLCTALFVCYWARPDRAMAATIIPPLIWAAGGLVLTTLGFGKARLAAALLWVVFLVAFAEPASLVRGLRAPEAGFDSARERGEAVRVIAINAAGEAHALAQVVAYSPDIVVLEEPPEPKPIEEVAHQLFGRQAAVAYGTDCDILYRGRPPAEKRRRTTVQARVMLRSGEQIAVVGTHLASTRPSFHLWRRDRWHRLAQDRRRRRVEMREVAGVVAAAPVGTPLILAGDFNAPAGDAVFRLLRPRLRDAFAEAGRGWGNTWSSDLPLVRIDQIWVSKEWRAVSVIARPAGPSDHRMVVCDLMRVNALER